MKMIDVDEVLKFEINENDLPKLVEKNVKLIDFIINNDSNYRSDNEENNALSTLNLVKQYKRNPSKDNLEKIIKAIDKQNSTHLSVSGNNTGDNKGIEKTVEYIYDKIGLNELNERIKNGDTSLVDEIAINAVNNRYIISFASKFCTYMSRYMFNDDKFSIYDGIMARILPYYYFMYVDNKKRVVINNKIMKKKGYEWYSSLIKQVIKQTKVKENYQISRKDLDHLLWYYYKGDKDIKDDSKKICYKSRITKAIEIIDKG
ncbi:MAG: hypothetical protein IKD77_05675 [Bacilli bacterium]|nr:hypothetical protein [Bacilli bacterium]